MFAEAKVIRLGEIEQDLHKKVTDLEAQVKPTTPPEVLEERRMTTTKAIKKIEEIEALCAKTVEHVSETLKSMINEFKLEKVAEQLRIAETEVTQLKNEMKKLPLEKKLQQKVATLQTQQQQRIDKVTELHAKT